MLNSQSQNNAFRLSSNFNKPPHAASTQTLLVRLQLLHFLQLHDNRVIGVKCINWTAVPLWARRSCEGCCRWSVTEIRNVTPCCVEAVWLSLCVCVVTGQAVTSRNTQGSENQKLATSRKSGQHSTVRPSQTAAGRAVTSGRQRELNSR